MGDGQTEVGDARLEIVVKAGERARRDHGVVGADPLASSRAMARDGAWWQAATRALNSGHRSAETLMARLRMRWARQRWRAEHGKRSSIARMILGAPSADHG